MQAPRPIPGTKVIQIKSLAAWASVEAAVVDNTCTGSCARCDVAGKVQRRPRRSRRVRRLAQQRKAVLLALAAAASSAASAVNGWGNPPASWQITAATCGFVLTACLFLASQPPSLQKKISFILMKVRLTYIILTSVSGALHPGLRTTVLGAR